MKDINLLNELMKKSEIIEPEVAGTAFNLVIDTLINKDNPEITNANNMIAMVQNLMNSYGSIQLQCLNDKKEGKICTNCKNKLEEDIVSLVNRKMILEMEVVMMKNRIEHSTPTHAIIYMCCTAILFSFLGTLLCLQIFKGIYLIHPYLIFTGIIGSVGLFLTSFLSLKDWKAFLNG